jgi:hypothetical protein
LTGIAGNSLDEGGQMGWGRLYQVDDSARILLSGCKSKSEWYDVLGQLRVENAPKCNAEDSIRFWGVALEGQPYPLSRLFLGDFHTPPDGSDDPYVCFLGRAIVRDVARKLASESDAFFVELFSKKNGSSFDSSPLWFLEPLRSFFKEASANDMAIVVLWET